MKVDAEFIAGAASLEQLPEHSLQEVCIAGRSNAGKSTFINALCQRKKLAHTSSVPGHTQQLNLYQVNLRISDEQRTFSLVDSPGYGYAKFSKEKREKLSKLLVDYISTREQLTLLTLVMDIRRDAAHEEISLFELSQSIDLPFLLVLTKSDKVKSSENQKRLRAHLKSFPISTDQIVLGIQDEPAKTWQRILKLMT